MSEKPTPTPAPEPDQGQPRGTPEHPPQPFFEDDKAK